MFLALLPVGGRPIWGKSFLLLPTALPSCLDLGKAQFEFSKVAPTLTGEFIIVLDKGLKEVIAILPGEPIVMSMI